MAAVTPLVWDSEFFGFRVAKVNLQHGAVDAAAWRAAIAESACRLCYVFTHDAASDAVAAELGATLVDRRTLLRRALPAQAAAEGHDGTGDDVATAADLPQVRSLALQSAQFSRFRVDPAMPTDAWVRMYERWADNSVSGSLADAVLVAKIDDEVAGMLTVSARDGEGTIGLFAVDEAARGRGFGTALLARGAAWFTQRGCGSASVVTQGDNLGAQRVYERAGYAIADVTNVYHLWMSSAG